MLKIWCLCFYLVQKCLSTPKLRRKLRNYEIQDGGRPPSLNSYITIIGPPTKSFHWDISLLNFVLIRYIVLKIWGFEFFAELA